MEEKINIRDEQGKFIPGNPLWHAGAFKPGHPGYKPNRFTPEEAFHQIKEYFDNQELRHKPPNMSGIRLALGLLSRDGFDRYRRGEFGKTDEHKRAYVDVFDWANLVIESFCEEELFREKGQVQGVIRALENKYGWTDVKHLVVQETKHTAVVMLEPELVAKMDQAAGIIDGDSGVLTSQ